MLSFFAHNDPLMGPEQVKTVLARNPGWHRDTWEPTSVLVAPSLDVAIERGVFVRPRVDGQDGMDAIGNYISVYRRINGEWKVQTDAKWLTDAVVGDSLCRTTNDGTGRIDCKKRAE